MSDPGPFKRNLFPPSAPKGPVPNGTDIQAVKRAISRAGFFPWGQFDDAYNEAITKGVKQFQAANGLLATGFYGKPTHEKLRKTRVLSGDAFDVIAAGLYRSYGALLLVYPQVQAAGETVCQGLHETGGIPNNWAMDFCAPGGTAVVAPFDCTILRLSGHDPSTGVHGPAKDVFGWSTYLLRSDGTQAFLTHQGSRSVQAGDKVKCGQVIGTVGNWPHDPGRSHTHLGVECTAGVVASKKLITDISLAPKVPRV